MKHVKMVSIEQFRHIVYNVNKAAKFIGMKGDEPVFDESLPNPIITAKGTIKLHGTCSIITANEEDIVFSSKNRVLEIYKDNYGFAEFCTARLDTINRLVQELVASLNLSLKENTISIFGEFVGKGIQKGVGISELDKSLFIFGAKVNPNNGEASYWIDSSFLKSPEDRIYNIEDYKTYSIEIDFNHPEIASNRFNEIVNEVETECPVAKAFGISGIGEGVVYTFNYKDTRYIFKTKGEKHSKSKVKKLKTVDLEKMSSIDKCAEEISHEWRYVQALTDIFGTDYEKNINRKKLGEYLKWVNKDTIKEEYDIIAKYDLEAKEVLPIVSKKAKEFFFALEKI